MKQFSATERILHKIGERTNPIIGPIRRKKLSNTDFTIISNNCWAGVCYEYFAMQKQSPTVGMYFFADEYIRFLSHFKEYLQMDLEVVTSADSVHKDQLIQRGQSNVLVGKLGDLEMTLLHYKDADIAKEKWKRRVDRISWDNLIFKMSYMNDCKDTHIHEFEKLMDEMPKNRWGGVKSIVFVPHVFSEYNNTFIVPAESDGQIGNDTFYWNKYCNVIELINSEKK